MTCLAFTAPAGVRVAKAAGAAAGIIVEAFVNVAVEEVVNGVVWMIETLDGSDVNLDVLDDETDAKAARDFKFTAADPAAFTSTVVMGFWVMVTPIFFMEVRDPDPDANFAFTALGAMGTAVRNDGLDLATCWLPWDRRLRSVTT